jgi:hypothetical protein
VLNEHARIRAGNSVLTGELSAIGPVTPTAAGRPRVRLPLREGRVGEVGVPNDSLCSAARSASAGSSSRRLVLAGHRELRRVGRSAGHAGGGVGVWLVKRLVFEQR